jgi:AcrR family transcriptional regulator
MKVMAATTSAGQRRRERERELVQATRALFDERGMQDAPIEEIAKAVGIARGLVYRQFSSKEELFVLTVTDYLAELETLLRDAIGAADGPAEQLERCSRAFARFCLRHPAFIDCSLSLLRRPARDLHAMVSESVWLRLGQGMAACLDQLAQVLRRGADAGTFSAVDDPDYMANALWTQALGLLHLPRLRVGVRQAAPGVPELFPIDGERVVATCVAHAMAAVGAP